MLALLIAESDQKHKDIIVRPVISLLSDGTAAGATADYPFPSLGVRQVGIERSCNLQLRFARRRTSSFSFVMATSFELRLATDSA